MNQAIYATVTWKINILHVSNNQEFYFLQSKDVEFSFIINWMINFTESSSLYKLKGWFRFFADNFRMNIDSSTFKDRCCAQHPWISEKNLFIHLCRTVLFDFIKLESAILLQSPSAKNKIAPRHTFTGDEGICFRSSNWKYHKSVYENACVLYERYRKVKCTNADRGRLSIVN